jgi:3-oxoacyl-[acyl-carrier protein] reductase
MNILITGGASGLGQKITEKFAENPQNKVYFTYSRSTESALKLNSLYPNTSGIKCDFNSKEEVQNLVELLPQFDIDVLVNNAYTGNPVTTHYHKIPHQEFSEGYNVNVLSVIAITQAAINLFRKKKSGKIITILTSYLANTPPTGVSVYVALKAYLKGLTKIWATENVKFNITSNSVSPSFMLTGLTKDVDERLVEQTINNHPLKKIVSTSEVAETVHFLAQASSQINGVDILMTGGAIIN